MKKRNNFFWLCLVVLSLPFASCQKDQFPEGAIASGQSMQTINDVEAWSWSFLSRLRSFHNGSYYTGPEIQCDMVIPAYNYGNRGGAMFSFSFLPSADYPADSYYYHYVAITNVNFFLGKVGDYSAKDEKEEAIVKEAKARAYFVRAFCYERLLSLFCRTEDPSTPGLALVTSYDPAQRVSGRASQKEVYDLIFSDLRESETLLRGLGLDGKPSSSVVTADAAVALRARANLTKLDYSSAKEAADQLITGGKYVLESDASKLKKMWHDDAVSGELIMMSFAKRPGEVPNSNSLFYAYSAANKLYSADWYPPQWVIDLYDAADFRAGIYFDEQKVSGRGGKSKIKLIGKYPGAVDLRSDASVPNATNRPKLFRIAEQYLIAAEAYFKLGDEAKAKDRLNELRVKRGLAATTESGDALWQEIKSERTRELAYEGFRLRDLRRWGDPVVRKAAQPGAFTYVDNMADPVGNRHEASDPHFVWPIPINDVLEGGLLQNPGY